MLYLILLLPLAMAALSLIRNDRARTVILAAGQALLLALLIGACTLGDTATPVWRMTADLTFSLRLDGLGRFFCLLTAVCWLLTIPYAAVYMTHEGHHPRFYVFLMLTEAAVLGAALAADLVTLYLFYELTTLLSFPLVLHTQRPKALLGAVKYLYYSVCGGFIALFGVVLLAKNAHIHAKLCQMMKDGQIHKTYLAAVYGCPKESAGEISLPVYKIGNGSLLRIVDPRGKRAVSRYRVLKTDGITSVLALTPVTGRTHQLRLHCKMAGVPILGDPQYASPASMLFSTSSLTMDAGLSTTSPAEILL